jgi:DNA-binding transcriptional regulator YhcF (GntR family)
MANLSGAIRAGAAYVELLMNDTALVRGLRSAQKKLRNFGSSVKAIGVGITAIGGAALSAFGVAAKVFSSMGDAVAKMSKRTGVSVESLSELAFVASQTGTNFSTLENAFRRMQRSIVDGERGLSTVVDAYDQLGISVKDLQGLRPEEQFKVFADALSKVEDSP